MTVQGNAPLDVQILVFLYHHALGERSNYYVGDDELVEALNAPLQVVRANLDALEEGGITTAANTHQGRRALLSSRGMLQAQELLASALESMKRVIGFEPPGADGRQ